MNEKKIVTVTLDNQATKVTFKGVWTRSDIDKSYRLMLKSLGEHIMRLREQDKKDKERTNGS